MREKAMRFIIAIVIGITTFAPAQATRPATQQSKYTDIPSFLAQFPKDELPKGSEPWQPIHYQIVDRWLLQHVVGGDFDGQLILKQARFHNSRENDSIYTQLEAKSFRFAGKSVDVASVTAY